MGAKLQNFWFRKMHFIANIKIINQGSFPVDQNSTPPAYWDKFIKWLLWIHASTCMHDIFSSPWIITKWLDHRYRWMKEVTVRPSSLLHNEHVQIQCSVVCTAGDRNDGFPNINQDLKS